MGIVIFGLNGCGKSTLGKLIGSQEKFKHMDIEDYYFLKSNIPYTKHRTKEECHKLILNDMKKHKDFVFSIVNGNLGPEIESYYKLGVFLNTPYHVRIKRVENRIQEKFKERVKPGGDMYKSEMDFLEFVKKRSTCEIEAWIKNTHIPILRLDGSQDIMNNADRVINMYLSLKAK